MIRKLTESDRQMTLDFLRPEAAINLFFIGDIEQDGFDKDFQEFWGSINEEGQLRGVLLRYDTNYVPYSPFADFDYTPFIELIKKDDKHRQISGKGSIIAHFKETFPDFHCRDTYFCQLTEAPTPKPCAFEIKKATIKDAPRICELLNEIEEFSAIPTDVEQVERVLKSGCGRMYYTESEEGILQNVVQTTAENSLSAMVVGVATRKAYRHQGLMNSCLSKLCYDLVHNEKKSLCLFYNNPEAGKIYHKLGFQTIDTWVMLLRKENE